MERDVKGHYLKAMQGKIENFTGISDPYQPPLKPEILVETNQEAPEVSLKKILTKLTELNYLPESDVEKVFKRNFDLIKDKEPRELVIPNWSV